MKYVFAFFLLTAQNSFSQKAINDDATLTAHLRATINYLADDKLEGRRTGMPGEKLAYEYLEQQFKDAGLQPFPADKNYLQAFDVNDGRAVSSTTAMFLNGRSLELNKDFSPFPFSAPANNLSFIDDDIAFFDITTLVKENVGNPHFDLNDNIVAFANIAKQNGKKLVIVKNEPMKEYDFSFEPRNKTPVLNIPVVYLFPADKRPNELSINAASRLTIAIEEKHRTGHNVVGYIDNHAANTIILGAHYDHLGYGEDHNSLYNGKIPMIHNGADDNASGTAALIELGRWLKQSNYRHYNYVLLAFSGEELGLFGSKYFTEHPQLDLKTVDYMINMDMVGRLNDSTHGLTIGGYGTSPAFSRLVPRTDSFFKINIDSSGSGPSDHTSFYHKEIPVLFFFTGSHKDYHKPTDDADKINYPGEVQVVHYIEHVLAQTDTMGKIAFTKTRDAAPGRGTFKVSLGIMPDYTFTGAGVMVDGVSDSRPAQRAGIQTGDVLVQLGDYKFTDVQTYMDALNKFNKGDSTTVKVKRGKDELNLPVIF